jgi:hypothetical protein
MPLCRIVLALALLSAAFFTGCSNASYTYRYVPGKTGTLVGGYVAAPEGAPERVKVAIAAANGIVGSPYEYGGGHGRGASRGFDCSGTTSHVLCAAGLLDSPMPSRGFRRYGSSGPGDWISVYARKGHVFLVIAGIRLDTGYTGESDGPRWTTRSRPAPGAVIRHPGGV